MGEVAASAVTERRTTAAGPGKVRRRERAPSAVAAERDLLSAMIDGANDAIIGTTLDGTITLWNRAAVTLLGYTASEAIGQSVALLAPPGESEVEVAARIKRALGGETLRNERTVSIRKDGTRFEASLNISCIRDADGAPIAFMALMGDVTEQERMDAAIRKLSRIVDQAPFSVVITDLSGAIEYVNPAFTGLTGYSKEEVLGKNPRVLKSGLTPKEFYQEMWRTLTAGEAWHGDFSNRKKSGEVYVERAVITPIFGPDHRVTHYAALKEDITRSSEAAEALRESEERYRSILDASPDGVVITDLESRVLMVSPMALRMLGAEDRDVVGHPILDFIAPEDRQLAASNLALRVKGLRTEAAEYRGQRLDGGTLDIEVNAASIRNVLGRPAQMVITVRDITARKREQEMLAASLREKEGLLRETHHSVKNNLVVITSLMRITGGQSSQPETQAVLKEMAVRIHSVLLLNEMLYKTASYTEVNLADYLTQLATHAFRAQTAGTGAIRLILEVSPVDVPTAQAIPCGLIVNELMTNSLKHAFPEGQEGEVRIALLRNAAGEIQLEVGDSGVGLPEDFDMRRGRSLGLQLVSDLARQLGGRLNIADGPGARFIVTFGSRASP